MKLKGVTTYGNGGDGIHISGTSAQVEDVISYGNKGAGMRVDPHPATSITNARLFNNGDGGLVVEPFQELRARFPALADADNDLILDAGRAVGSAAPDEQESALRSSALGQWLSDQAFVDWAGLVVDILALLQPFL